MAEVIAPDPMVQRAMREMGCTRVDDYNLDGLPTVYCRRHPSHWTSRGCGYAVRIADALYEVSADRKRASEEIERRWPVLAAWARGGAVLTPDLIRDLRAVLDHHLVGAIKEIEP